APELAQQQPLDLGFRKIAGMPEPGRPDERAGCFLDERVRAEAAQGPVPFHAGHRAPAFTLGERAAEGEAGAFEVGVMAMQRLPVVEAEAAEPEAARLELERDAGTHRSARGGARGVPHQAADLPRARLLAAQQHEIDVVELARAAAVARDEAA